MKPLWNLLENDAPFVFDDSCLKACQLIKEKLVSAPIVIVPDWSEPLEIMFPDEQLMRVEATVPWYTTM